MENPFLNVDTKKAIIKAQQREKDNVMIKRRGRPRRPNMVKKLIKVDEVLYAQVGKLAEEEHTTIASIIARSLKKELSKN